MSLAWSRTGSRRRTKETSFSVSNEMVQTVAQIGSKVVQRLRPFHRNPAAFLASILRRLGMWETTSLHLGCMLE
jgi:hypothetical protein